jgi:hypothetical protein
MKMKDRTDWSDMHYDEETGLYLDGDSYRFKHSKKHRDMTLKEEA